MFYSQTLIDLQAIIATANGLKPLPASVTRLISIVNSPNFSTDQIVEVIRLDQALTLTLLKAANSSLFGADKGEVTTVEQAVDRLGGSEVLNISMANQLKGALHEKASAYGYEEGGLWRHSVAAALAVEVMGYFTHSSIAAESFTAALLHDIGKLVLSRFLDPQLLQLLKMARDEGGLSFMEAETEVLQVHHGEVGGIIAQHWNLPERIVKAIIYHHAPEKAQQPICDVVHVANLVAKIIEPEVDWNESWDQCASSAKERLQISKESFHDFCDALVQKFQETKTIYNI